MPTDDWDKGFDAFMASNGDDDAWAKGAEWLEAADSTVCWQAMIDKALEESE